MKSAHIFTLSLPKDYCEIWHGTNQKIMNKTAIKISDRDLYRITCLVNWYWHNSTIWQHQG